MALGDIIADVLDITARVDKDSYIRGQVNPLIRMLAGLKDHPITLVELPFTVSNSLLVHTLQLPADFRSVEYLRPASNAIVLTPITPGRGIIRNAEATNVYYQTGSTLKVRLRNGYATTELGLGYYAHPSVLISDLETNWVLDDYGDVVTDLLIAKVFRLTGDTKSAASIEAGTAIRLAQIQASSVTSDVLLGQ